MKKQTLLLLLLSLLPLGLLSCQKSDPSEKTTVKQEHAEKEIWQCPMHPQIIRDKNEPCPICGMDLVKVKKPTSEPKVDAQAHEAPILSLEPAVIQKTGVKILTVGTSAMSQEIQGYGSVSLNDNRSSVLALRVGAFATQVPVLNVGSIVSKGQVLAKVYSPEWKLALSEVQLASKNAQSLGADAKLALSSAMQKAENLGLEKTLVSLVSRGGQIPAEIPVLAPRAGVILDKKIIHGQAIGAGEALYRIGDLSELWIMAEFPQSALKVLDLGQKVEVRLDANPDQVYTAKIVEILPELNPNNKAVQVRLSLSNAGQRIKIGQSAKLNWKSKESVKLNIPEQAVLPKGDKYIVIKSLGGGQFQVVEVQVGTRAQGQIQILRGLKTGDQIVESAQFLMDSESNLRSAIQSFGQDQGDSDASHAH